MYMCIYIYIIFLYIHTDVYLSIQKYTYVVVYVWTSVCGFPKELASNSKKANILRATAPGPATRCQTRGLPPQKRQILEPMKSIYIYVQRIFICVQYIVYVTYTV